MFIRPRKASTVFCASDGPDITLTLMKVTREAIELILLNDYSTAISIIPPSMGKDEFFSGNPSFDIHCSFTLRERHGQEGQVTNEIINCIEVQVTMRISIVFHLYGSPIYVQVQSRVPIESLNIINGNVIQLSDRQFSPESSNIYGQIILALVYTLVLDHSYLMVIAKMSDPLCPV